MHNPWQKAILQVFQPGVWGHDALRLRQGLGQGAGGQEPGPAGGAPSSAPAAPWATSEPRRPAGPRTTAADSWNCWTWWSRATPWWTHIDRLSRGLTYGLQVIEGLHLRPALSSGPCRRTSTPRRPPASSSSRWCSPSANGGGTRSGSARSPARRRLDREAFPRPTAQPDRAATGVRPGGAVERSEPAGTGQALGG